MDSPLKEVLEIEREATIPVLKPRLIAALTDLMVNDNDKAEFLTMCSRAESTIRAWYHRQFEEMMQLYLLFDPVGGHSRLLKHNLSPPQVEKLENTFLQRLFTVLKQAQYKLLTDRELEVATSGKYMLDLPIAVDTSKLDLGLLSRYFREHYSANQPSYAHQYLLFRRGLGVDQTKGLFLSEKIDVILVRLWSRFLTLLRVRRWKAEPLREAVVVKKLREGTEEEEREDREEEEERKRRSGGSTVIERRRIENMPMTLRSFFSPVTLQEPTFDRVTLVYRKATPASFPSDLGDRGIHIMQFHHVPMADLEICLPEKRNPGLTPQDWLKFIISGVGGLYAIWTSLEYNLSLTYIYALGLVILGYFSKVYFTWQASMAKYRSLITESMYDKHLDSGRGTLLHLCDDVIQQEVKEVILAYFVLISQGKATKQELDERCEDLLLEEFKEDVDFDVEDALDKLIRLGIVTKTPTGQLIHKSLKIANDIIGLTTDEMVEMHDK